MLKCVLACSRARVFSTERGIDRFGGVVQVGFSKGGQIELGWVGPERGPNRITDASLSLLWHAPAPPAPPASNTPKPRS